MIDPKILKKCAMPVLNLKGYCIDGKSGFDIADLEGVDFELLQALTTGQDINISALIERLETRAIITSASDFMFEIQKQTGLVFDTVIDSQQMGHHSNTFIAPGIDKPIGKRIKNCQKNKYAQLRISSVQFTSDAAGVKKIFIKEAGCDPVEMEFNIVCGVNNIPINYLTSATDVTIYATFCGIGISDGKTDVACPSSCGCNMNACCCSDSFGIEISNLNDQSHGFGVCVEAVCDETKFICNHLQYLYLPVWLRMGLEIANEGISSRSPNPVIANSRDHFESLKLIYGGGLDPYTQQKVFGKYRQTLKQEATKLAGYMKTQLKGNLSCDKQSRFHVVPMIP